MVTRSTPPARLRLPLILAVLFCAVFFLFFLMRSLERPFGQVGGDAGGGGGRVGTAGTKKLLIAQKALSTEDTAVSNQKNVNLLRFEARAAGADSILLNGASFTANGAANGQNYALWVDTDGDRSVDTVLQQGVASQNGTVTFDAMQGGGYSLLGGEECETNNQCANGQVCSNCACIPAPAAQLQGQVIRPTPIMARCTDSDGGRNSYMKGTTTNVTYGGSGGRTWTDTCLRDWPGRAVYGNAANDPKALLEGYCLTANEGRVTFPPTVTNCPTGCAQGVCALIQVRVSVLGGTARVQYTKNFDGCAVLRNEQNQPLHQSDLFCQRNGTVDQPRTVVQVSEGQRVKLCDPTGSVCSTVISVVRIPTCPDGVKDPNEECDDGNQTDNDSCSNRCKIALCGDGIRQSAEECERNVPCTDLKICELGTCLCKTEQTSCGNGVLDLGEECDRGVACPDGKACELSTCLCKSLLSTCGNSTLDRGEECDIGIACPADKICEIGSCRCLPAACPARRCGNGAIDPFEGCDNGSKCSAGPMAGQSCLWDKQCSLSSDEVYPCVYDVMADVTCNAQCMRVPVSSARSSSVRSRSSSFGDVIGYRCAWVRCEQCFVSMGGDCREMTLAQCEANCGGSSASSASSATCAQDGQKVYVSSQFGPTECCSRNAGIKPGSFLSGDVCLAPTDGSQGTCVDNWWFTCGDGTCGTGEDKCSCPGDCRSGSGCGNGTVDSAPTVVFEVHADIASSVSATPLQLQFNLQDLHFIRAEKLADGNALEGIEVNGSSCGPTPCAIGVTTASSTVWNVRSQGDLYVTLDSQTIGPRQLLAGALNEPILRMKLHAEYEDIDVGAIVLNSSGGLASSIDLLELWPEGGTQPIAVGGNCGLSSVITTNPGSSNPATQAFCFFMLSQQLVVPKGMDMKVLVRPRLKTDVNGATSGDVVAFFLDPTAVTVAASHPGTVLARGVQSMNTLSFNDGDNASDGEVFIGRSTAGSPNYRVVGNYNTTVLSKFTSIVNGGPSTGTVPSGADREIGAFTFTAAQNTNTKNGLNQATVSGVTFTVFAMNVSMQPSGFKLINKSGGSSQSVLCFPYRTDGRAIYGSASGVFLVECHGLTTSLVNTAIDSGQSLTLALLGNVTNTNTMASSGGSSILKVSLNQFANSALKQYGMGGSKSYFQWLDKDNGSLTKFTWVEYPDNSIISTSYSG